MSVLILGAGFGYWRISQGPLSLGFMSGPIERFVNASLDGMRLRVKDVVIERDPENNTIHLRLRRAQLEDRNGQMIARAPRAGVGLSGAALLSGEIRPTNLEFIGPRILIKRTIDGEFQLGFGDAPIEESGSDLDTAEPDVTTLDVPQDLASEPGSGTEQGPGGVVAHLFRTFAARTSGDPSTSDLDSISISDAAVSIYDEANEAFWYAPKTNVVFQRVPYGISVLAHGNVSGGQHPWKLQLAANYIADTGRFKVTAKVLDLVPAEMSDLIFAFSNLAKVQVPLSGEAHFEFDGNGSLLDASASFTAGAGLVGFPRFITESMLVDEGAIELAYEPLSGDIVLRDSSIHVGGSRASLNGRFSPLYNDTGRLVSWRYRMAARNVSLDTEGTLHDPLAIDSFDISGLAAIDEGRLDIDDLQLNSGDSRVRLRGTFIEGPEVPAVYLRGTMRNAALPMIKNLWPPEAAPGARNWIIENMSDDTVLDGDLAVNLTSEALAAALVDAPLPNDQLSFAFKLRNVTTNYFRGLPPVTNAEAEGLLRGNDLEVRLSHGEVTLENGDRLKVANGRFYLENLAQPATIGDITVDVAGTSSAVLRLIDHEPLGYAKAAGIDPDDLGGSSLTRLHVRLPMLETVTFDQVEIAARSELSDMSLASVFKGGDIDTGTMVVNVDKQGLVGKGRVSLNGVTTDLTWREDFTVEKGGTRVEAAAVLTEQARKRLNLDLSGFLRGTVSLSAVSRDSGNGFERLRVEADLSQAELLLEQVRWRRNAGNGAKATFDVHLADDGTTSISDLQLSGPDHLSVKGSLVINPAGQLVRINMPVVNLGAGNRFTVTGAISADGVMAFRIDGDSFDARPLVDSMFGSEDAASDAAAASDAPVKSHVSVVAQVKTLFLHNNEHLTNVGATLQSSDGDLQQFRMTGQFANAQGVEVTITPDGTGQRPIRVVSDDAGAALRAVNLYTRSHGGTLKLQAVLGAPGSGELKDGRLGLRDFIVRNEPVLRELGSSTLRADTSNNRGRGPAEETRFDVLKLKFQITETHLRINDEAIIHGPSIGSTVRGSIRREDGRLNIAGTLTPAYALNSAISNFPILGPVLMGGEGQGLIGVTFAVTGSLERPRVTINPVSALAPGFLRRFLEIGGDGTQPEPAGDTKKPRRLQKPELR